MNIKNPETVRLVRELAEETGESLTATVTIAVRERLAAVRQRRAGERVHHQVAHIQRFVASLPDRDCRSAEQILGYDRYGLPG